MRMSIDFFKPSLFSPLHLGSPYIHLLLYIPFLCFYRCPLWYILLQSNPPTSIYVPHKRLRSLNNVFDLYFSKSEVEIIRLITVSPGISSTYLQEALSLDQPHVSRVLKRLLSKGCIRRVRSECTVSVTCFDITLIRLMVLT